MSSKIIWCSTTCPIFANIIYIIPWTHFHCSWNNSLNTCGGICHRSTGSCCSCSTCSKIGTICISFTTLFWLIIWTNYACNTSKTICNTSWFEFITLIVCIINIWSISTQGSFTSSCSITSSSTWSICGSECRTSSTSSCKWSTCLWSYTSLSICDTTS